MSKATKNVGSDGMALDGWTVIGNWSETILKYLINKLQVSIHYSFTRRLTRTRRRMCVELRWLWVRAKKCSGENYRRGEFFEWLDFANYFVRWFFSAIQRHIDVGEKSDMKGRTSIFEILASKVPVCVRAARIYVTIKTHNEIHSAQMATINHFFLFDFPSFSLSWFFAFFCTLITIRQCVYSRRDTIKENRVEAKKTTKSINRHLIEISPKMVCVFPRITSRLCVVAGFSNLFDVRII